MSRDRAAALLQHPLVLRASWDRVRRWYTTGVWVPQPEFARWRLHPDAHLDQLARSFLVKGYQPEPFRLIPYPKKGAILRHYTVPSVRDQVAFTAFAVLLAPILESQMKSFSFGNRWHRALYRDHSLKKWRDRPFSLMAKSIYQPYRRAHSLFRRVCSWTASAMAGERPSPNAGSTRKGVTPDDYVDESIPKFAFPAWWGQGDPGASRQAGASVGYWCRLDLQLAFPSVRISRLAEQLQRMLALNEPWLSPSVLVELFGSEPASTDHIDWTILTEPHFDQATRGYPPDIIQALRSSSTRRELGRMLTDALAAVRYDGVVEEPMWQPSHADQRLPTGRGDDHPGLPTGLAISGLLLNVYLDSLDRRMAEWVFSGEGLNRAAFVRFADDMTLFARDPETLLAGIDTVWSGLEDQEDAVLASPPPPGTGSNMRVNWAKVEPAPVAHLVDEYKSKHGWEQCKKCQKHVIPPKETPRDAPTLAVFAASLKKGRVDERFRKSALRSGQIGPFVTYLVERLSDLGSETLLDRFGETAEERMVELHSLLRFDLNDHQVRPDTRLAFAANRLSQAWLPNEGSPEDRRHLLDIRRSIRQAVLEAPWKFSLWRAALRAAARRPFTLRAHTANEREELDSDDQEAKDWLGSMLRLIQMDQSLEDEVAWLTNWPEPEAEPACAAARSDPWKDLYVSYIRAVFWCELAEVLHDLHKVSAPEERQQRPWSPRAWTYRAVSEESAGRAAQSLADLDRWAEILYGEKIPPKLPWWELDAIGLAALATRSRSAVLEHANPTPRRSPFGPPLNKTQLKLPRGLTLTTRIEKLLQTGDRMISSDQIRLSAFAAWSLVLLSKSDGGGNERERLAARATIDFLQRDALAVTECLHINAFLPINFIAKVPQLFRTGDSGRFDVEAPPTKTLSSLWHYKRARAVAMALMGSDAKAENSKRPTIHRLLWSAPDASTDVSNWRLSPGTAPAVGLPIRIALEMLHDALAFEIKRKNKSVKLDLPIWWIPKETRAVLEWGRRWQLGIKDAQPSRLELPRPLVKVGSDIDWEVLPHPLYFLLRATSGPPLTSFMGRVWAHILLFLTAADGGEGMLDKMLERWPDAVPFEDWWTLRRHVHLSREGWGALDQCIQTCRKRDRARLDDAIEGLLDHTKASLGDAVTPDDFLWERVDIGLSISPGGDREVARAVRPLRVNIAPSNAPEPVPLDETSLVEKLRVRIAQVCAAPNWTRYTERLSATGRGDPTRDESQRIMRQVWSAFMAQDHGGEATVSAGVLGPIVLPEVTIPLSEVLAGSLRSYVAIFQRAVLVGALWRPLPTVIPPSRWHRPRRRYLVNEAVLLLPLSSPLDVGPPLVREFTIRKPIPAHADVALAEVLSGGPSGIQWTMLPGSRWYRFAHPQWGDFTVGICSDLLDPTPWISFRGQILHLFLCAYNKDVDLYESLTWVRAYENYVNVVAVNHGSHGGSFVWTPSKGLNKEIATLRGGGLFLIADIDLFVKRLLQQQRDGSDESVKKAIKEWSSERTSAVEFKSLPPQYFGRKKAGE